MYSLHSKHQRPNSWAKSRQKSEEFSSLLFANTYTALHWDFYFFKLSQHLTVSTVHTTVHCKGERRKPGRKPHPLLYGLRNLYKSLKSENYQYYDQKHVHEFSFTVHLENSTYVIDALVILPRRPSASGDRYSIVECRMENWKKTTVLGSNPLPIANTVRMSYHLSLYLALPSCRVAGRNLTILADEKGGSTEIPCLFLTLLQYTCTFTVRILISNIQYNLWCNTR